jgi:hypothetical protein
MSELPITWCFHCRQSLKGEAVTFLQNDFPDLGGCHLRCTGAYHAARIAADYRSPCCDQPEGVIHARTCAKYGTPMPVLRPFGGEA